MRNQTHYLPFFFGKTITVPAIDVFFEVDFSLKSDYLLNRIYASCSAISATSELIVVENMSIQLNNYENNWNNTQPNIDGIVYFEPNGAIQPAFMIFNSNQNFIDVSFKNGLEFLESPNQNMGLIVQLQKIAPNFPIGANIQLTLLLEFEDMNLKIVT